MTLAEAMARIAELETELERYRPRYCKRTGVRLKATNKSGYEGVSYLSRCDKWAAHVFNHGKRIYLGQFDCPDRANTEIIKYWEEQPF
jgi:hypothetical protein